MRSPAESDADSRADRRRSVDRPLRAAEWLAWAQGGFFFASGLWPLLHLPSFLVVTGPKTDLWLVQTVGGLLAVAGAALMLAARRRHVSSEWIFLGAGLAAVLAAVDVVFVGRGTIPPVYLADAAVETLIVLAWLAIALRRWRRGRT